MKQWKCLVRKNEAKANINLVEQKSAEEVRKYFISPKTGNEVFG